MRDALKQLVQLFKLHRQRLNVMFRRNAEAIQGASYPCVESFFDLVELNFDLAAYATDFFSGFVDLVVGCIELFVDALLATFFNAFAGFDQLVEILGTFLADAGIGADTCQPIRCIRDIDGNLG